MTAQRFIVVTSIQGPTPSVEALARIPGWRVVLVADSKTPRDWRCGNVTVLPFDEQDGLGFSTARHLPVGHYARKNLGYLYAMREGAELIFETDDDNRLIPLQPPVFPREMTVPSLRSHDRFVNVYRLYTERHVWPRGFPLDRIRAEGPRAAEPVRVSVPVQQSLANQDPDVDAVYRLVSGELFDFERTGRFALTSGQYCPFNSQATLWYPEAYWTMLLPGFVPMRVTDIWRGYIAQALLYSFGHGVLFSEAAMIQDRNVHDLLGDFLEEIPLYRDVHRFVSILEEAMTGEEPLDRLVAAYEGLHAAGLIEAADVRLANAWATDIQALGGVPGGPAAEASAPDGKGPVDAR